MKFFYENYMATLVAMATIHEKIQMTFPMKLLELILMKFHIYHLYYGYTKVVSKIMHL